MPGVRAKIISAQPQIKYRTCRKVTDRSITTWTVIQINKITPVDNEAVQLQCMCLKGLMASGQRQDGF